MKFLIWDININSHRLAKIHLHLYKIFGIKRKIPCGQTKKTKFLCCSIYPINKENSYIINDNNVHEIRCLVCGHTHLSSNKDIKSFELEW